MASTGSGWPPARRAPLAPVAVAAIALTLLLAACAGPAQPEAVVQGYLSDATGGDSAAALERWELSQLGPAPADIGPKQSAIRLDGRRQLARSLTTALAAAGDDLRWETAGLTLYDLADGVAVVTESADEAEVASVASSLTLRRGDAADVEESLAFTLWRRSDGGWRVTGLDKGLAVLEDFLRELGSE